MNQTASHFFSGKSQQISEKLLKLVKDDSISKTLNGGDSLHLALKVKWNTFYALVFNIPKRARPMQL